MDGPLIDCDSVHFFEDRTKLLKMRFRNLYKTECFLIQRWQVYTQKNGALVDVGLSRFVFKTSWNDFTLCVSTFAITFP